MAINRLRLFANTNFHLSFYSSHIYSRFDCGFVIASMHWMNVLAERSFSIVLYNWLDACTVSAECVFRPLTFILPATGIPTMIRQFLFRFFLSCTFDTQSTLMTFGWIEYLIKSCCLANQFIAASLFALDLVGFAFHHFYSVNIIAFSDGDDDD